MHFDWTHCQLNIDAFVHLHHFSSPSPAIESVISHAYILRHWWGKNSPTSNYSWDKFTGQVSENCSPDVVLQCRAVSIATAERTPIFQSIIASLDFHGHLHHLLECVADNSVVSTTDHFWQECCDTLRLNVIQWIEVAFLEWTQRIHSKMMVLR